MGEVALQHRKVLVLRCMNSLVPQISALVATRTGAEVRSNQPNTNFYVFPTPFQTDGMAIAAVVSGVHSTRLMAMIAGKNYLLHLKRGILVIRSE